MKGRLITGAPRNQTLRPSALRLRRDLAQQPGDGAAGPRGWWDAPGAYRRLACRGSWAAGCQALAGSSWKVPAAGGTAFREQTPPLGGTGAGRRWPIPRTTTPLPRPASSSRSIITAAVRAACGAADGPCQSPVIEAKGNISFPPRSPASSPGSAQSATRDLAVPSLSPCRAAGHPRRALALPSCPHYRSPELAVSRQLPACRGC